MPLIPYIFKFALPSIFNNSISCAHHPPTTSSFIRDQDELAPAIILVLNCLDDPQGLLQIVKLVIHTVMPFDKAPAAVAVAATSWMIL